MSDERRIKRHVYLPGLSAYDSIHRRAATMEMGFQGTSQEFKAGSIFVDTQEARSAVIQKMQERHWHVQQKLLKGDLGLEEKRLFQREYRGLKAAMTNVHVIDSRSRGFNNQEQRDRDILFVKGHGGANRPDSITSRVTPVSRRRTFQSNETVGDTGIHYDRETKLEIKRGFNVEHTSEEIAVSIHNIAASIDSPGLDVRITSCGSAGTASRDENSPRSQNLFQTFAGKVSTHLDKLKTDRRVEISGYQGDTNSSLPQPGQRLDSYITKIKQKQPRVRLFQHAKRNQEQRFGFTMDTEQIDRSRPVRQNVKTWMEQRFPAPQSQSIGTSNSLLQRMQAFTKVTKQNDQQQIYQAYAPRMLTRITIPRRSVRNSGRGRSRSFS